MSESILSTKKKIPIATRDFCVLSESEKWLEANNYDACGFLPHNIFYFCVIAADFNAEFFPPNCVAIYDLSLKNGCNISADDFIGSVNPYDEDDLIDGWKKNQGIYFCLRNTPIDASEYHNEVVYVGKANNLLQRFSQHHKKKSLEFLGCDRIIFLTYNPEYYTESDVLWAERQYIDMLKPVLNDRNDAPLFDAPLFDADPKGIYNNDKAQSINTSPKIDLEDWIAEQLLDDVDWQKVRSKIAEKAPKNAVWDQAYNEGLKHGFASAKNSMMEFFDSAIQLPKLK